MIDDPSLSTNRRLDGCLGGEAGPTVLGKKFPLFGSKLILSMQLDPSRFDHSQQTVFYFKVQVIHNFTPWQHFVSNQFVLTIQCIHKSKEGAWHPASTSTAIKGVRIKVRMHVKVCTSALKVRAWVLKVPARVLKAYGSVSEACTWVSKLEGAVAVMCPLHARIYTLQRCLRRGGPKCRWRARRVTSYQSDRFSVPSTSTPPPYPHSY